MNAVSWSASPKSGTWWLGVGHFRIFLKAPWNEPVFSEKYGCVTRLPIGFGWRFLFRSVKLPPAEPTMEGTGE